MKRDVRLLIAMLLFLVSSIAWAAQAWIVHAYIFTAVMGQGWNHFAEFFGVEAPASGPDRFCFGYCAPELPFVTGWIGIITFLTAWVILARAWWKPRA